MSLSDHMPENARVSPVTTAPAPASNPAMTHEEMLETPSSKAPMHTHTQSTLAPTSEYVRYLLLALPARYIPRGVLGTLFDESKATGNSLRVRMERAIAAPGNWIQKTFPNSPREEKMAIAYNTILGAGSLALTASYSWTVYKDVKNIFSEAVAMETGKDPADITFNDLQRSDNRMVQKTMQNFWQRFGKRMLTDVLFFPAAAMRSTGLGDLMVGVKAGQAFAETWKRKTTMFEDLVTFVNNKINPRNGLGQAISVGEVFDLYQHYCEKFTPDRMFTNVVEHGSQEGVLWAASQPIFTRLTELMNDTYAYKHSSLIDPVTGDTLRKAHFPLPKFIYLLGHDLIDVNQPQRTLVTIEVANRYGIPAVKEMNTMLAAGKSLESVMTRYPVTLPEGVAAIDREGKNGVIAKGSTMQIDQAPEAASRLPVTQIDTHEIAHVAPEAALSPGLQT